MADGTAKRSHIQIKHATKSGTVTISFHGNKDIPKWLENSILKQAGIKTFSAYHYRGGQKSRNEPHAVEPVCQGRKNDVGKSSASNYRNHKENW